MGDNGRQWDKGRQDLGKVDTPSNTGRQDKTPSNTGTCVGRQWETMGTMEKKGRQDLGKVDTPSNTSTHVGTE